MPFERLQRVLTRESIGLKIFQKGQRVLYTTPPEEQELWQDDDDGVAEPKVPTWVVACACLCVCALCEPPLVDS